MPSSTTLLTQHPKVPTLLTVLSAGDAATNELVYGTNTNSFVLQGAMLLILY